MSRDLTQLAADWREHPCLRIYACSSVEQLAEMLEKHHHYLMSDDALCSGYLYQKQVEINRKLKQELKECQQKLILNK